MATKTTIVELVNNMILWTRNKEITWESITCPEMRISVGDEVVVDDLIYITTIKNQCFRLFKCAPNENNSIMALVGRNIFTPKPSISYHLQIYDKYKRNVLFEFPRLSQLFDLYKAASKQVFDIDAFLEQLDKDADTDKQTL